MRCSTLCEQEGGWRLWLHSLKVAQLLRSAACLHTNQSRSYLNHLVFSVEYLQPDISSHLHVYYYHCFSLYFMNLDLLNPILTVAKLRMTSVHVIPLTVFYTPIACAVSCVLTIIHRPSSKEGIAFNLQSKIGC